VKPGLDIIALSPQIHFLAPFSYAGEFCKVPFHEEPTVGMHFQLSAILEILVWANLHQIDSVVSFKANLLRRKWYCIELR